VTDRSRDNGQGGDSFAERLSPLIAQGGKKRGVIPVPGLLVHFQGALGITDGELVYLLHVLDEKRSRKMPFLAVSDTAKEMHRDERNVRSRKQSLQKKKLIVCRPGWTKEGDRGADEHDLTPLFAELERLAIEVGTTEALDQVRAEQPEPTYYRGQIQMAPTPPKRLSLAVRRRTRVDELAEGQAAIRSSVPGGGENAPTPLAKSPPAGRRIRPQPAGENIPTRPANSPAHAETGLQRSETEVLTEEIQTGLAPAARPPGGLTPEDRDSVESNDEDESDGPTVDGRPADPGIAAYVEQWAAEFDDDDPSRTLATVTHWCWSSHLPAGDVHNAMKRARHETRQRERRGRLQRPMAYAMTALHTALSERCVACGLAPLAGAPVDHAPPDEGAMMARADRMRRELAALPDLELLDERKRKAAEHLAGELAALEAELAGPVDALKSVDQVERRAPGRTRRRRTTNDAELAAFLQEAAAS